MTDDEQLEYEFLLSFFLEYEDYDADPTSAWYGGSLKEEFIKNYDGEVPEKFK